MSDENLLDFTPCSKYTPSTTYKQFWAEKIPGWFLAELLVHQPEILGIITIFHVNLECIFTQKNWRKKANMDLSCARTSAKVFIVLRIYV